MHFSGLDGNKKVVENGQIYLSDLSTFLICEPGSGKSPYFDIACKIPIEDRVKKQKLTQLMLDDFTEMGMFQQLKNLLDIRR